MAAILSTVAVADSDGVPQLKTGWTIWVDVMTVYHISHPAVAVDNFPLEQPIVYKSTDAGASWASVGPIPHLQDGTSHLAVWFDQWTPGDVGTVIHIAYIELDGFFFGIDYVQFNTATDLFTTPVVVFTSGSATGYPDAQFVTITKSRAGALYIIGRRFILDIQHLESTDNGATWDPAIATLGAIDQFAQLVPGNETDPEDIYLIVLLRTGVSPGDFEHRFFDHNLNSWDATPNAFDDFNVRDTTEHVPFSFTIRHSDGHLFVAAWVEGDPTPSTDDIVIYEIVNNAGGIVTKARFPFAYTTSLRAIEIVCDQETGDLYLFYPDENEDNDGVLVVMRRSVDNGVIWSSPVSLDIGDSGNFRTAEYFSRTVSISSDNPERKLMAPILARLGTFQDWVMVEPEAPFPLPITSAPIATGLRISPITFIQGGD